ncbi:FAD/NAD(P)-binding domain-containing protein [Daldinia eschscholtzii]|nr:FAD/NAD(P)-binding domain-containing protein [Daldinia eschscholtzii]
MEEFARVQAKYSEEAQKRVRPEGADQFQTLEQSGSDQLRHLADDFWANHAALDALQSPLKAGDRPKFLIAGAGIGGIGAAVRLIEAGFSADQIRIIETAGGIGGTWYWNRYPGLHCDVESYVYLPLLEETGFVPSQKYSSGIEIRKYLEDIVKRWNLQDKILFRSKLDKIEWDENTRLWKCDITTERGPKGDQKTTFKVEAEFVWVTAGLLSKPQVPKLAGVGIEGFKGDAFHTARWDYDVTGGSQEEVFPELSKLKDKRVGIVGTGATAIQVVPCLADYAKELHVFQRTPAAVYGRGQKPTDPEEWKKIAGQPGWHEARRQNLALNISNCAPPGVPDLVDDEWSRQVAYAGLVGDPEFAFVSPEKIPEVIGQFLARDAPNQARLRARIAEIVKDKETAEKLTPWYPVWCKRPTFSDTYLQSFNKPNVHLIDTDGKGVDSVTPEGLVANGQEIPLDVIVFSTGYRGPSADGADPSKRAGVAVHGRDGKTIEEAWANTGAATLHGYGIHGFPNLFWHSPLQSGVGANHAHVLDVQCKLIAYVLATAHQKVGGLNKSGVTVEVEEAAQEAWSMKIMQGAGRFATVTVCTPSYINNEGKAIDPTASPQEQMKQARASPYSAGLNAYIKELQDWRDEGNLKGIEVTAS